MTYWDYPYSYCLIKILDQCLRPKNLAIAIKILYTPFNFMENDLQNHSWILTQDGSWTLFSERFQEACHSTAGALAETHLHYIQGCRIEEKTDLSILEVGFGLGVGFLATYDKLHGQKKKWTFLSLEIDHDLLEWFRLKNLSHDFLSRLHWKKEGDLTYLEAQDEFITLTILAGDARRSLPLFAETFCIKWNAIYQDAFSPKKNPTLWTKEWFELLKRFSTLDVTLSTYSASSSIRKGLHETGWILSKGERFGLKRTSTRAGLQGETDPEILLHLQRSPALALTDDNIKDILHN